MSTLTLATYGFFLYDVRNGTCERFGSPAMHGQPFRHECRLLTLGAILHSSFGTAPEIPLRDCLVSVGPVNAAPVHSFEIITAFESLSCNARLKAAWHHEVAADTDVQVALSGGELRAFADRFTNGNGWTWKDCDGRVIIRQTTSLTVWTNPDWSGLLQIVPRKTGGTSGSIQFDGNAVIGLLNKPVHPTPAGQEPALDRAHAAATNRLCRPAGAPVTLPAQAPPPTTGWPPPALPSEVMRFLGLLEEGEIDAKGRPNCGARQMSA